MGSSPANTMAVAPVTALASQGMTFRNAYVFPICSTTRYSILFGRYPRRERRPGCAWEAS